MVRSLVARIRGTRELLAFAVVGAAAFVVQMGLFDSLGRSGVGPLTANAISVVFATAVAFVGNRFWVFRRTRGAWLREAVSFAAVNAATFVLSEAVLALAYPLGVAYDRFATDALVVIGIAAASVVRFLAYRGTVFRGAAPAARADAGAAPADAYAAAPSAPTHRLASAQLAGVPHPSA
jgi:putative flippase GtrA